MKLYRIKKELKKYFDSVCNDRTDTLEGWKGFGVTLEALEEVESRVELTYGDYEPYDYKVLRKRCNSDISQEERMLCEQALNGELFTKEEMLDFGTICDWGELGQCYEESFQNWLKESKA